MSIQTEAIRSHKSFEILPPHSSLPLSFFSRDCHAELSPLVGVSYGRSVTHLPSPCTTLITLSRLGHGHHSHLDFPCSILITLTRLQISLVIST